MVQYSGVVLLAAILLLGWPVPLSEAAVVSSPERVGTCCTESLALTKQRLRFRVLYFQGRRNVSVFDFEILDDAVRSGQHWNSLGATHTFRIRELF